MTVPNIIDENYPSSKSINDG